VDVIYQHEGNPQFLLWFVLAATVRATYELIEAVEPPLVSKPSHAVLGMTKHAALSPFPPSLAYHMKYGQHCHAYKLMKIPQNVLHSPKHQYRAITLRVSVWYLYWQNVSDVMFRWLKLSLFAHLLWIRRLQNWVHHAGCSVCSNNTAIEKPIGSTCHSAGSSLQCIIGSKKQNCFTGSASLINAIMR
jgi:hypothetical protein